MGRLCLLGHRQARVAQQLLQCQRVGPAIFLHRIQNGAVRHFELDITHRGLHRHATSPGCGRDQQQVTLRLLHSDATQRFGSKTACTQNIAINAGVDQTITAIQLDALTNDPCVRRRSNNTVGRLDSYVCGGNDLEGAVVLGCDNLTHPQRRRRFTGQHMDRNVAGRLHTELATTVLNGNVDIALAHDIGQRARNNHIARHH